MINKDDNENLTFGALAVRQRFLFWGIMLYADDDGIIPIRLVKSRVFPFDEDISFDEVVQDLKKLEELSFLIMYQDNEYIQVCDWWKRQKIRKQLYRPTNYPIPPRYIPREEAIHNECTQVETQNSTEEDRTDKTSLEEINNTNDTHRSVVRRPYPEYVFD